MEPNGRDRPWDDRVREAVTLGPEQLRNLLSTEQPPTREKYVLCLELICQHHEQDLVINKYPQVLQGERCRVLFNRLRDDVRFHPTRAERAENNELSTRGLRRRRRALQDKRQPLISFYDLFVASIVRWQDRAGQAPQDGQPSSLKPFAELNCPPVTKLIWEEDKQQLFDGGAIHACAQHGLDVFLQALLGPKIRRELKRDVKDLLRIGFLAGPDTVLTPLGIAIQDQQYECSKCTPYIRCNLPHI